MYIYKFKHYNSTCFIIRNATLHGLLCASMCLYVSGISELVGFAEMEGSLIFVLLLAYPGGEWGKGSQNPVNGSVLGSRGYVGNVSILFLCKCPVVMAMCLNILCVPPSNC